MGYEFDVHGELRLKEYFAKIGEVLSHKKKKEAFALYAIGLLSNLDRKSVEPIAAHVCSDPKQADAMHQRLLHFQSVAAWDDREVRLCAARYAMETMVDHGPVRGWIIDDTGFLKQGEHSVGVQRQYTGSAGKIANCQLGVSLTVATSTAHLPIDFELYLPERWTNNAEKRREGKIPDDVEFKTKIDLALDMITRACQAGLAGNVVLADSAYGDSKDFRAAVRLLGLDYGVAIPSTAKFVRVDEEGRPTGTALSVATIATALPKKAFRRITWRHGTGAFLSARFAFVRGRVHADGRAGEVQWLIVEWRDREETPAHFGLTTLGIHDEMSKKRIVRTFKERYRTEQAYEELKGELGLDHFEGRSLAGWHHHITVVLCCYAFVIAERMRHFPPSVQWSDSPEPLSLAA